MNLIDTHCHIDSSKFDQDRDDVLMATLAHGIKKIVVPATTQDRWHSLLSICNAKDWLYPALGLHPLFLAQHQLEHLDELETVLSDPAVLAVGEIGLDYFVKNADVDAQKKLLDTQLALASKTQLPVILHCRKAYDDLIAMLKLYPLEGGIAHAFNGSIQQAYKLIDMGYKLGFGGTLTYKNARKIRQLAKSVPVSSIVIETDSPDMTVSQHKGERNSPAYLPFVLQALDDIRAESKHVLAEQTYQNSVDIFKLS